MNLLNRTKTYLVGSMQYEDGVSWRETAEVELGKMGIIVFNPYNKPFVKDIKEGKATQVELLKMQSDGNYDELAERMREIRVFDLNLVDRSDFIIVKANPKIASWGSSEELVTAVRMKKPIFFSCDGGKKALPLWIFGQFPHKYIYNSVAEILEVLKKIDAGEIEMDSDRWRLLRKEYR